MNLHKKLLPILLILLLSACTEDEVAPHAVDRPDSTAKVSLEKYWETGGLSNPESVIYDDKRDRLYVSNIAGAPLEKNGAGFISIISLSGDILEEAWIVGLDAPKGLALYGDSLYVSDIDRLIKIDVDAGIISGAYPATGALFLNDVAATSEGIIFVSDMVSNRIYRLDDNQLTIWIESQELESPNGLYAQDEDLIVATWGVMENGFATETPGHMKKISYSKKEIKSIGKGTPIGNLDGVERDTTGSYYVTDWMAGKLLLITSSGNVNVLLQLEQGMADHALIASKRMIFLPMMNSNKLLAYKIID